MGTTSTVNGLPAPADGDGNDVVSDLLALVAVLDTGSVVKRLTSVQIAALSAGQKPAGLVVYNTTTGRLQVSNGSTFDDHAEYSDWTDYTPTLSQGTATDIAKTVQYARWCRVGNMVHCNGYLVLTAAGASGYPDVTLPVASVAAADDVPAGQVFIRRVNSAGLLYGTARTYAATGLQMLIDGGTARVSGDSIGWAVAYEVAP